MRRLPEAVTYGVNTVFDLFSYRSCVVCRTRLGPAGPSVCRGCARELLRLRLAGPVEPPAFAVWDRAGTCERLAGVWVAAAYRGLVRDMLLGFKFQGKYAFEPLLSSLTVQRFRHVRRAFSPDLIVPVPTTLLRFLHRGTNLPQALARSLSARCRIRWSQALRRKPFGRRQARKSRRDRLRLSPESFWVPRTRALAGRSVLLVDDVLTTGGTAVACAKRMLGCGAKRVGVLALAHG